MAEVQVWYFPRKEAKAVHLRRAYRNREERRGGALEARERAVRGMQVCSGGRVQGTKSELYHPLRLYGGAVASASAGTRARAGPGVPSPCILVCGPGLGYPAPGNWCAWYVCVTYLGGETVL